MKVGGRRFRPQLWPTLATLLLLPLFVHLGLWQHGKAERKAAQQALLEQRLAAPPVDLARAPPEAEALRYSRVVARGRFEAEYQFLLDNQVQGGRAGFHVLTPLRIEGTEARVLVNRGWVPFSGDRSRLPRVDAPEGVVEVRGHGWVPPERYYELKAEPETPGWQPVWQNLDLRRYAARVPFRVLPAVVRMDPDSPAGGYVREWARPDERIGMHRSYAIQWFVLAAALAGAWLWFGFERPPR
jgi:surfeit locus 1 family protein